MKCKYYKLCGAEQGYRDCDGEETSSYGCAYYQLINSEIENDIRNGLTAEQSVRMQIRELEQAITRTTI